MSQAYHSSVCSVLIVVTRSNIHTMAPAPILNSPSPSWSDKLVGLMLAGLGLLIIVVVTVRVVNSECLPPLLSRGRDSVSFACMDPQDPMNYYLKSLIYFGFGCLVLWGGGSIFKKAKRL